LLSSHKIKSRKRNQKQTREGEFFCSRYKTSTFKVEIFNDVKEGGSDGKEKTAKEAPLAPVVQ
jgi:hypothetical protein